MAVTARRKSSARAAERAARARAVWEWCRTVCPEWVPHPDHRPLSGATPQTEDEARWIAAVNMLKNRGLLSPKTVAYDVRVDKLRAEGSVKR